MGILYQILGKKTLWSLFGIFIFGWEWVAQVEYLSTSAVRVADKLERLGMRYEDGRIIEVNTG